MTRTWTRYYGTHPCDKRHYPLRPASWALIVETAATWLPLYRCEECRNAEV